MHSTNRIKSYEAWLIDPTRCTVEARQLPTGLINWLRANMLCILRNDEKKAYEMMHPLHHDLPMDAMMDFIGEGEGHLIFANDMGGGVFLVLHDDVRDQKTEQPCFTLDYNENRSGPGRGKPHFRRGVLIKESGEVVPRSSFTVCWGENAPANSSGYAVEFALGKGGFSPVITDIVENPHSCGYCRKTEMLERFMVCGGCKRERYCSRGCQRSDWKLHKATCRLATLDESQRVHRMRPAPTQR